MTLKSPLHEEHLLLGAKLTEFGGWEMPLKYSGVIAEHRAVRETAGLFDVSHLGKLVVSGEGSVDFVDSLLPGKVQELAEWKAGYNLILNPGGGIIDDIFVYRLPDKLLVVPNASNTLKVLEVLEDAAPEGIVVEDARMKWAILALSGPEAKVIGASIRPETADLRLHSFAEFDIAGTPVLIARTGYTGEFTLEFFVPWKRAGEIWSSLIEAGEARGLVPTGLGARDTLRLEMGYPLHGHEIDTETNPVEAGLSWLIRWDKASFIGREAVLEVRDSGPQRKLVGLLAQGREIPREGYPILHQGTKVGELTSGNFSPTLSKGIAMGYVPTELTQEGTLLTVEVRGRELQMKVVAPPFVES